MPSLSGTSIELSSATNIGTIDGGSLATLADTAWGTTTATLTETSPDWTLDSINGTSKTTLDCQATYTDSTAGTADREKVVKTGMATAKQGISRKLGATVKSKLETVKLVTGALSTVATVGAAITALSLSF